MERNIREMVSSQKLKKKKKKKKKKRKEINEQEGWSSSVKTHPAREFGTVGGGGGGGGGGF